MKNNYLLEGTDYVSLQNKIAEIIKANSFQNSTTSIYDLDETVLENALEDLDTYSFLTAKKVILIKNIENISQDEVKKDLEHLYHYLDNPNPDNLLFIISKKLNNTLKVTKELKKRCEFIQVALNALDYAKKELKDYKITPAVLNLLMDYCKNDITKLKNECLKLKTYKFNEKEITKGDIEELCIEKLGDGTELTFSFTRALAEKNKKEALLKYKELLNYNIEPLNIIGLLASQFRIMLQVKILEEKSLRPNEISETLGEKPFRITKTKELTRYYTSKELRELMIKLQSIDIQIKTTDSDPNSLIELFILNI